MRVSLTVCQIKQIEDEMARTQKNKATSYHLGMRDNLDRRITLTDDRTIEGETFEAKARTFDPVFWRRWWWRCGFRCCPYWCC